MDIFHQREPIKVKYLIAQILGALVLGFILWSIPFTSSAYDDTDLVNVWTMDESSGTRADSVGGFTLTDNNTVGSHASTCMDSGCADFAKASSESLSYTAASFQSTPYTISFWVRYDTLPSSGAWHGLYEVCDQSDAKSAALSLYNNTGTYKYDVSGTFFTKTVSTNTWYHIVMINNGTTQQVLVDAVYLGGVAYASDTVSANKFVIGDIINCNGGTSYTRYLNGDIDEYYVFDSVLSTTSIESLYASGVGDFYPFGSPATTSSSTTATSTVDVEELKWVLELYLAIFSFLIFTYLGYRFTKMFL